MNYKNLLNLISTRIALFVLLILITSFVRNLSVVKAQSVDFVHDISANYVVSKEKKAKASYTINTVNKVGNNYLQTFTFNLPFEISNISVADSPTPIQVKEFKKIENGNFYVLTVDIVRPVFGLNKSFTWKVNFEIENILIQHGMQSALVVPNFNDDQRIGQYTARIELPKSLGPIAYTYGNSQINDSGESTIINFSNLGQNTSTFMVLIGPQQEYFLETIVGPEDIKINLPLYKDYQEIFYTEFPKRDAQKNNINDLNQFDLKGGESIKAFIIAKDGVDKTYEKSSQPILNPGIAGQFKSTATSNYIKANEIFKQLVSTYSLNNFITLSSTTVDISGGKNELNPAELNEIYRQALSANGIENRGVYGYVFPIQPFLREEFKTDQHIWTEFWDGEKWIIVDPTWFITSKGNDYFGKNYYHHIKFGNYQNLSDIKSFFDSSKFIKITPLQNPSYLSKDVNVVMQGYSEAFATKNFRFELVNNSNQPINLYSINPQLNLSNIKIPTDSQEIDINTTLYPNSKISIDVPLDYGILWKDVVGTININLDYKDIKNESKELKFTHAINVRSNISSYLSEFIIGLILVFLFISVISFILYKKF